MNTKLYFWIWLASCGVFFIGQSMAPNNYSTMAGNPWGNLFGTSFIVGVLSFILMFISAIVAQRARSNSVATWFNNLFHMVKQKPSYIIPALLILLLLTGAVRAANSYTNLLSQSKQNNPAYSAPEKKYIKTEQVISEINSVRNSKGLSEVNQDAEACAIANNILKNSFYQTGLKIEDYRGDCKTCFTMSVAMAKDIDTASQIVDRWKTNKATSDTLNYDGKNSCIAVDGNNVILVGVKKDPGKVTHSGGDPMINCTMSANCGGGTRLVKQSECNQGTCCQIKSTWIWYPSKDQCTKDQSSTQVTQPIQQQAKPTTQLNYYCYDNTNKYSYYTSSGEQCNKDNLKSSCLALAKSTTYDPCMDKCLSEANESGSACVWAYVSGNAAIQESDELYTQCSNEVSQEHQTCMDGCVAPYEEVRNKCY